MDINTNLDEDNDASDENIEPEITQPPLYINNLEQSLLYK